MRPHNLLCHTQGSAFCQYPSATSAFLSYCVLILFAHKPAGILLQTCLVFVYQHAIHPHFQNTIRQCFGILNTCIVFYCCRIYLYHVCKISGCNNSTICNANMIKFFYIGRLLDLHTQCRHSNKKKNVHCMHVMLVLK